MLSLKNNFIIMFLLYEIRPVYFGIINLCARVTPFSFHVATLTTSNSTNCNK
jgi:hypothetical protein